MSAENRGLPPDLKESAQAVVGYFKIAQHICDAQYPDREPPAGLLPALINALSTSHAAKQASLEVTAAIDSLEATLSVCGDGLNEVLEKIESTLNDLPERLDVDSVLLDRLAGIEQELFRTANYIGGKVAKS